MSLNLESLMQLIQKLRERAPTMRSFFYGETADLMERAADELVHWSKVQAPSFPGPCMDDQLGQDTWKQRVERLQATIRELRARVPAGPRAWYEVSAADTESAIRAKLIEMGWTPPATDQDLGLALDSGEFIPAAELNRRVTQRDPYPNSFVQVPAGTPIEVLRWPELDQDVNSRLDKLEERLFEVELRTLPVSQRVRMVEERRAER